MASSHSYGEDRELRVAILEGIRVGEVPLKLAYCGELGEAHLRLARSEQYLTTSTSLKDEVALVVAGRLGNPVTLIDVGVGSGTHAAALIRQLNLLELNVERYIGLDVSALLLGAAKRHIADAHRGLSCSMHVWDFEMSATDAGNREIEAAAKGGWSPAAQLGAMLGLTLGNVSNPVAVLRNIRQSLGTQSLLLLGLASPLASIEQMMSPYLTKTFTSAALAPYKWLGVDVSALNVDVEYRSGSVVAAVRALDRVTIPQSDIRLQRGMRIIVFRSRRFRPEEVEHIAAESGWNVELWRVDSAGHMTVLLRSAG